MITEETLKMHAPKHATFRRQKLPLYNRANCIINNFFLTKAGRTNPYCYLFTGLFLLLTF